MVCVLDNFILLVGQEKKGHVNTMRLTLRVGCVGFVRFVRCVRCVPCVRCMCDRCVRCANV